MKKMVIASIAGIVTIGFACAALAALPNSKPLPQKAAINAQSQKIIKKDDDALNNAAKAPINGMEKVNPENVMQKNADQKVPVNQLPAKQLHQTQEIL